MATSLIKNILTPISFSVTYSALINPSVVICKKIGKLVSIQSTFEALDDIPSYTPLIFGIPSYSTTYDFLTTSHRSAMYVYHDYIGTRDAITKGSVIYGSFLYIAD